MKLDAILSLTDSNKFIDELNVYVTNPDLGGVTPDDVKKAPPMVEAVIYVGAFHLTIGNSGIWKWFIEIEDYDQDITKVFGLIGASDGVAYVEKALALLPDGRIPKSLDERFDVCDAVEDRFRILDRKFQNSPTEGIRRLRDYINKNKKEFEEQVSAFWEYRKKRRLL